VRFLAYTGLRWGEMAALQVCDFDSRQTSEAWLFSAYLRK
jgi:integrase